MSTGSNITPFKPCDATSSLWGSPSSVLSCDVDRRVDTPQRPRPIMSRKWLAYFVPTSAGLIAQWALVFVCFIALLRLADWSSNGARPSKPTQGVSPCVGEECYLFNNLPSQSDASQWAADNEDGAVLDNGADDDEVIIARRALGYSHPAAPSSQTEVGGSGDERRNVRRDEGAGKERQRSSGKDRQGSSESEASNSGETRRASKKVDRKDSPLPADNHIQDDNNRLPISSETTLLHHNDVMHGGLNEVVEEEIRPPPRSPSGEYKHPGMTYDDHLKAFPYDAEAEAQERMQVKYGEQGIASAFPILTDLAATAIDNKNNNNNNNKEQQRQEGGAEYEGERRYPSPLDLRPPLASHRDDDAH